MLPPSDNHPGIRLRRVILVASVIVGQLGLASAAGLLLLVRQTVATAEELRGYDATVQATERVRLGLVFANRENFMAQVVPGTGHDELRDERLRELDEALAAAGRNVQSPEEGRVVAALAAEVDQVRAAFEARTGGPLENYRRVNVILDRALTQSERLLSINRVQAEEAVARAARWQRVASAVALALAVIVPLLAVAVAAAAARTVYEPLRQMEDALARYARGDPGARMPQVGPAEFRVIAARFDEMADALDAKRQQQLTFLAAVAHDLRNPLTTLRTAAQLTARDAARAPERVGERASLLLQQIDRLGRMVDDLLDVSRVEAGQLALDRRPGDLREAVRDAALLFADASDKHTLEVEIPEEPVVVDYDPLRIDQVLVNLLSNAIKYAPAGGPVRLRLDRDAGHACLSVEDRGMGIPKEDLPLVFQPFRRGAARQSGIPGVGLGLSASQKLVHAHGGTIEVESTLGEGSTFRILLPLAERAGA